MDPQSQTVFRGGTATLSVVAVGTQPLSYQWLLNNTNLSGATTSSLVFTDVQLSDAGTYSVILSNSVGTVISSNALLTVNLPCVPAPSGLVSWWPAEGNAIDIVGGNNGTLINGAGFAPGEVGQAFAFNGVNQFVQVSNAPSLNPTNELTLEQWVNVSAYSASDAVILSGKDCLSCQAGYSLGMTNVVGGWFFRAQLGLTSGYLELAGATPVQLNTWHHVAMTFDGSALKLYVNGILDGSAVATGPLLPDAGAFVIGGQSSGSWDLNGRVDEVSLYGRALTAAEIQYIYDASSGGKCSTAGFLVDLDFGMGQTHSYKVGFAAIGQTTNDFWNYYTRDDGNGGYLTFGVLSNLALVDGTVTPVGMTIANAPGGWANGSTDPMYDIYLYPLSGGNVTVTLTNLPTGLYNVLPYSFSGNFEVTVGGVSYGIKQTSDNPVSNPSVWTAGKQYALYTNVQVSLGQPLVLTVRPVGGYATISGMQIAQAAGSIAVSPFIVTQPTNQTVLVGATATFGIVAGGTPPLSYQWNFNGSNITGATGTSLTLTNVQLPQGGSYAVLVANAFGSVLSSNVALAVGTGPTITSQPISQSVPLGSNATFSVGANGTPPLAYQWSFNGSNITGATNASLTLTNVQLAQAGAYAVRVTNLFGSLLSSNAALTVLAGPTITTQPVSLSLLLGSTAVFTVVASGTPPLAYQWSFNATNMTGATNASLTLTNVQLAQGGTYAVLVTNSLGSVLSSNAVLTVNPSSGVSFLVDLDFGMGRTNSAKAGFAALGQTTNDFWNYYTRDDGKGGYLTFGVLSNLALVDGTVTSMGMTIANAPGGWANGSTDPMYDIYLYPLSGGIVTVTLTNLPTGLYDVLPYSWGGNFEVTVGGVSYGIKQTSDNPVSNPPVWREGVQYARYTNVQVSLGQPLVLTVRPVGGYAMISGMQIAQIGVKPTIVTPPQSQTVQCSSNASFTVTATGTPPLAYQWCFGTNSVSNATNSLLTLTNVGFAQAGNYSVVITNAYGSATGGPAVLTVVDTIPPTIISCASNQTLSVGGNCTATLPDLTAEVVAWDASGPVTVTQNPPPGTQLGLGMTNVAFTVQDSSGNASFCACSVTAVDTTPPFVLACVLQVTLGFDANCQALLPDLTGTNYIVASDNCSAVSIAQAPPAQTAMPAGTNLVVLTVSDASSNQTTRAVNVIVPGEPHIAVQPADLTLAVSSNATFSVLACGAAPLFFQWQYSGTNLPGATNAVLTLSDISTNDAGDYDVVITNSFGWITSAVATLTVLQPPVITWQPASQLAVPGCTVSFWAVATGTGPLSYQWQKDGLALAAQTNPTLILTNVQTSDFGAYALVVTNACGCVTSSNAVLSLDHPPVAGPVTIQRFAVGGVRVNAGVLLANDTDPDGDSLTIVGVSSNSTMGGTVSLLGNWVFYLPPPGYTNSDAFTYTVSDGHCGVTAQGTVTVQTKDTSSPGPVSFIESPGDGSLRLTCNGVPGWAYKFQYAGDLPNPLWEDLTTVTADTYGTCEYIDWPPTNAPTRFYRSVLP
jgi:hypothetical protein